MAFQEVPLASLADNDHNPRQHLDDDRIAELANGIDRLGPISPLAVRPAGDGSADADASDDAGDDDRSGGRRFEVVAGTRRLHALGALRGGDHMVPCRVPGHPTGAANQGTRRGPRVPWRRRPTRRPPASTASA